MLTIRPYLVERKCCFLNRFPKSSTIGKAVTNNTGEIRTPQAYRVLPSFPSSAAVFVYFCYIASFLKNLPRHIFFLCISHETAMLQARHMSVQRHIRTLYTRALQMRKARRSKTSPLEWIFALWGSWEHTGSLSVPLNLIPTYRLQLWGHGLRILYFSSSIPYA